MNKAHFVSNTHNHPATQPPIHPLTHSLAQSQGSRASISTREEDVSRDLSRSSRRERLRRHRPRATRKGAAAAAARATATSSVRFGLCFFQSQTLLLLSGRVKSTVRSLPHDVSQSSGAGAACIADALPHACHPYDCLRQCIATHAAASKATERRRLATCHFTISHHTCFLPHRCRGRQGSGATGRSRRKYLGAVPEPPVWPLFRTMLQHA